MPGELEAKFDALLAKVELLEAELARKDQVIAELQRRLFGRSSERLDPAQAQLLFGEAVLGKPEPPPAAAAEGGREKPRKRRRKKSELFPENLAVVVEDVLVPDEVAAAPGDWEEIGEEHHDELDATKGSLFWRRKVRKKFKRKGDRAAPPVVSPAPEPSLPGTLCAPDLAAQVVCDKYCDHLPQYRQSERFMRRCGAVLGRSTLNGWTMAAARHLTPVGEEIKRGLREAAHLGVDETPVSYLSPGAGKAAQGYLWVYRDIASGAVYYDWQLGRGHDCLLDVLGVEPGTNTTLFKGTVQCDGYSAYTALVSRYEGVRLGGCLAHIRRRFFEAAKQAPEVSLEVLSLIRELYAIEGQLRDGRPERAPPACRELVRRARARPIVERLEALLKREAGKHLPKSKLGEALGYALGQWEEFKLYLGDGVLEIDQNLVENAIRPVKLGAKNYLFFGNAEAGSHNALFYTLIENCKAQGIDPERYIAEAIRRLPADPTQEQAAAVTPAKLAAELKTPAIAGAA